MSSNKRSAPDSVEWGDTSLRFLNAVDLKFLCQSRELDSKGRKEELLQRLEEHSKVDIDFEGLTIKELRAELRLRGLRDDTAKKDILLARLSGEATNEPPKKRRKVGRGRKPKIIGKLAVYVGLCMPPDDKQEEEDEPPEAQVVGVYKDKNEAREACIEQLFDYLEKMEDKMAESKKKEYDKWTKSFDKIDETDVDSRHGSINEICKKMWEESLCPYTWVIDQELQ